MITLRQKDLVVKSEPGRLSIETLPIARPVDALPARFRLTILADAFEQFGGVLVREYSVLTTGSIRIPYFAYQTGMAPVFTETSVTIRKGWPLEPRDDGSVILLHGDDGVSPLIIRNTIDAGDAYLEITLFGKWEERLSLFEECMERVPQAASRTVQTVSHIQEPKMLPSRQPRRREENISI